MIFNFFVSILIYIHIISTKVFANSNYTKLETMSNHYYCEENPSPVGKLIYPPICLTTIRDSYTCLFFDLFLFWSEINHKFRFRSRDNEIVFLLVVGNLDPQFNLQQHVSFTMDSSLDTFNFTPFRPFLSFQNLWSDFGDFD